MDAIDQKAIFAMRSMLTDFLESGSLRGHRATEARMALGTLDFLLRRSRMDAIQLERLDLLEASIVSECGLAKGDAASSIEATPRREDDWRANMGAMLSDRVAAALSSGSRGAVAALAERLLGYVVAFNEPVDPVIAAGSRAVYGTMGQAEEAVARPVLTKATLQGYLRNHVPKWERVVVTGIERVQGGYSKATFIVACREADGIDAFVIRQDRPGLPTDSSVVQEFGILSEVHAAGVPVPRPLWLETHPAHFGTAIMAVAFSAGEAGRALPQEPERQFKWAESFADVLAKLHSTSIREADARAIVTREVTRMKERFLAIRRLPHPGIMLGLEWLLERAEVLNGRPVCRTHGDLAFHNVLMKDDRVAVALDWEFSHFCDPAEDLAYIRPFIDEFGLWPEFLERYRSRGGLPADGHAMRYFDVYNAVKICVGICGLLDTALMPENDDIKLVYTGTVNLAKFEVDAIRAVQAYEEAQLGK